jgi:hypothetical protein
MFRSQQCRILGEIEDVGSAITPECAQVPTNIKWLPDLQVATWQQLAMTP